ncbi:hypothetical protein ABDK96_13985 [Citricoccus nitrophenolicus]|uniref:Uncharacterized protein n=1 Tax=Citricoccus nitrophenolicus TaxID=863575 RepID=A0ABV0IKW5_9MICC
MPDLAQLEAVEISTTSIDPEFWKSYSGGWKTEISTALIDAVFSIRSTYRSGTPGKGVYNRLVDFREQHGETIQSLATLVAIGEEPIRKCMGEGRSAQRLKSEAVVEAAGALTEIGVDTADDFRNAEYEELKTAYTGVRGLGWITFEYFAMLLGRPGVKADTMIVRFVNRALQVAGLSAVDAAAARDLVIKTYERSLKGSNEGPTAETLTHFEHAIWLTESNRAAAGEEDSSR